MSLLVIKYVYAKKMYMLVHEYSISRSTWKRLGLSFAFIEGNWVVRELRV